MLATSIVNGVKWLVQVSNLIFVSLVMKGPSVFLESAQRKVADNIRTQKLILQEGIKKA